MPGCIDPQAQFSRVKAVKNGDQQGAREGDPDAQRVQRSPGIIPIAVLEEEVEAAEEADQDTSQQKDYETL